MESGSKIQSYALTRGEITSIVKQQSIKTEYQRAYSEAIKRGKSPKNAMHEAAQRAAGLMDAYWKRVLPQYGFEYVTRKRGYRYGR